MQTPLIYLIAEITNRLIDDLSSLITTSATRIKEFNFKSKDWNIMINTSVTIYDNEFQDDLTMMIWQYYCIFCTKIRAFIMERLISRTNEFTTIIHDDEFGNKLEMYWQWCSIYYKIIPILLWKDLLGLIMQRIN